MFGEAPLWSTAPWINLATSPFATAYLSTGPEFSAPDAAEAAGASGGAAPSSAWRRWGEAVHRTRRDLLDLHLYDLGRLDDRARAALAGAPAEAVIVAHPHDRRGLAVYRDAQAWGMSLDAGARALALIGRGSSPTAAAAFARQAADALGEPVVTTAPPRRLQDLLLDLAAPFDQGGRPPPSAPCAGVDTVLRTLDAARSGFTLLLTHGLGGRLLADVLGAEQARSARGARAPVTEASRIVTIGGAPGHLEREDALHLIGALDWWGWAISDPGRTPWRVAPFAGGHLNTRRPGALPLEGLLREAVADLGLSRG